MASLSGLEAEAGVFTWEGRGAGGSRAGSLLRYSGKYRGAMATDIQPTARDLLVSQLEQVCVRVCVQG